MNKIEINVDNPQTYDDSVMNIIGEQNNYYDYEYLKEKQRKKERLTLIVRAQAKLIKEQEQLNNWGELIVKSERTIFGRNWIEIYENVVIGSYDYTEVNISERDRNFRHGFARIWRAGSKGNNVRIYVDQNPEQRFLQIAPNGIHNSDHLYYNVYTFTGIKNAENIKRALYERIDFHHPEEA